MSRRARVTPDQVGLPAGQNRRVPGLRRSEVATLAGLSVEYYAKIERGAIEGASEQVLDAITRALLLDDAERDHLILLARTAAGASPVRRLSSRTANATRPSLQRALDAVTAGPAFVRNGRMDLVGELSTRSDEFRTRWGSHNVRHHGTGTKRFHHPLVGDLTLAYEGLEMAAEPGLTLTIYTAEPESPSAERLQLLGSWAAIEFETLVPTGSEANSNDAERTATETT